MMGRLLRAECARYVHDRVFWMALAVVILANMVVLTGGHQLEAPGREVLGRIMMKSIATMMIVGVYAGLSFGGDFEKGMFSHPIRCGWRRGAALLSKVLVFTACMAFATIVFPLCAVVWCTISNGWGAPLTLGEVMGFTFTVVSLFVLAVSMAMVPVLVSVAVRSVSASVAAPLGMTLLQIPVLNGANALAAARILPFGAMWFVAEGKIDPLYGIVLGVIWSVLLFAASAAILNTADMK